MKIRYFKHDKHYTAVTEETTLTEKQVDCWLAFEPSAPTPAAPAIEQVATVEPVPQSYQLRIESPWSWAKKWQRGPLSKNERRLRDKLELLIFLIVILLILVFRI